ncbi:hypothetical protein M23134_08256, partial [Microscilla marina ATCC 23134]
MKKPRKNFMIASPWFCLPGYSITNSTASSWAFIPWGGFPSIRFSIRACTLNCQ